MSIGLTTGITLCCVEGAFPIKKTRRSQEVSDLVCQLVTTELQLEAIPHEVLRYIGLRMLRIMLMDTFDFEVWRGYWRATEHGDFEGRFI